MFERIVATTVARLVMLFISVISLVGVSAAAHPEAAPESRPKEDRRLSMYCQVSV